MADSKERRPTVAPTRLCDLAVLVEKQHFRAFGSGFAGAPRHHFFHLAGDATFFELGFEDLMDLRIFILILDLIAAFFAADFALAQHS